MAHVPRKKKEGSNTSGDGELTTLYPWQVWVKATRLWGVILDFCAGCTLRFRFRRPLLISGKRGEPSEAAWLGRKGLSPQGLGNWIQNRLSSPSRWPRFCPQIRQQGAQRPAWGWVGPGPSMPSFWGSSDGAWVPVGPGDIVSMSSSFPRGTQGRARREDRVTSLDTAVPNVTEARGRPEGGTQMAQGWAVFLFIGRWLPGQY